ncbi:hypothetical protein AKJ16_DCAP16306 [Drosera capensis]
MLHAAHLNPCRIMIQELAKIATTCASVFFPLRTFTLLIASWTESLVWHQSLDPWFSSDPFSVSTSSTVVFSSPLCCMEDDDEANIELLDMLSFRLKLSLGLTSYGAD